VEEARDIPEEREISPQRQAEQPQALPHYPADSFDANFSKWQSAIEAGKRTPDQIIAMVESKAALTGEQKQKIREVEA
jgi:hypothetical protein